MKDDSLIYRIVLISPSGEEVIKKSIRIYPLLRKENEASGHMRGVELARDAMFHAGFWEDARAIEREKRREQLLVQIEDAEKQLKTLNERTA